MVSKRNNSQPDNSKENLPPPMPEQAQAQQIEAVICPTEIWDQIKNQLRKLPVEDVEVVLLTMKSMRPQVVNMQMPPGGMG